MHEDEYVKGTVEAPEIGVYAGWVAHRGSLAHSVSGSATGSDHDLAFAGESFFDDPSASTSAATSLQPRQALLAGYDGRTQAWARGLNGQFAGLLIDRSRRKACLFNDRYGAERLYLHADREATYFSSEAKALLRLLPQTRAFDDVGVAQWLNYGCTLDGRTLFRHISLLDGGSVWTVSADGLKHATYFDSAEWESLQPLEHQAFQNELNQHFAKWVSRYVRGSERIGISLTGGLDSRMIMAALPALSKAPVCYTFVGVENDTLDGRIGARVAAACGLEHHRLRLGPDFLTDHDRCVDQSVYITDGAAGATWSHELYLDRLAAQLAPVRLTGNFGSEVLRGMSTLKPIGLATELIDKTFRQTLVEASHAPPGRQHPVTFAAFREVPWKLFGIVAAARSQLTFRTPYLDNDLVALAQRAQSSVRASPVASMALIAHLHPLLAEIPTDRNVIADGSGPLYALQRLLAEISFKLDYLHAEDPPRGAARLLDLLAATKAVGVFGLHKWLPYRLWYQSQLSGFVRDRVAAGQAQRFWDRTTLTRIAGDHISRRRNHVAEINAIVTLEAVDRLLLHG
jgi:asparagine synthase (glutamine-hydrolysing)